MQTGQGMNLKCHISRDIYIYKRMPKVDICEEVIGKPINSPWPLRICKPNNEWLLTTLKADIGEKDQTDCSWKS